MLANTVTYLVAAETVVLCLLALLIVGLLRSHAEILKKLDLLPQDDADAPPETDGATAALVDINGEDLALNPVTVELAGSRPHLLAFLSTGCLSCEQFWHGFSGGVYRDLAGGADVVFVTKGRHEESVSKLRRLAPPGATVVMSSEAWTHYEVPVAPYFLFVDNGVVRGGGAASSPEQVVSLLRDSIADETIDADAQTLRLSVVQREDTILAAAGIGPDHPSLHDQRWLDDDQ